MRDRPLEVLDGARDGRQRVLADPPPALQEQVVGLDVLRRRPVAPATVPRATAPPRARRRSAARRRSGSRRCRSSRRSYVPVQSCRSVSTSMSVATMRTRSPACRTLPSTTVAAPSRLLISVRVSCRCLNGMTEPREITCRARILERCAMTSSVIPSAKYSFSGSALRLRNGSTAMDEERSAGAKLLRQGHDVRVGGEVQVRAQAVGMLARVADGAGPVARGVERAHQCLGVHARVRIGGHQAAARVHPAVHVPGSFLGFGEHAQRARVRVGELAAALVEPVAELGRLRQMEAVEQGTGVAAARRAPGHPRRSPRGARAGRSAGGMGSAEARRPSRRSRSSPSAERSTCTARLSRRRAPDRSRSGQSSAMARSRESGWGQAATTRVSSAMRWRCAGGPASGTGPERRLAPPSSWTVISCFSLPSRPAAESGAEHRAHRFPPPASVLRATRRVTVNRRPAGPRGPAAPVGRRTTHAPRRPPRAAGAGPRCRRRAAAPRGSRGRPSPPPSRGR